MIPQIGDVVQVIRDISCDAVPHKAGSIGTVKEIRRCDKRQFICIDWEDLSVDGGIWLDPPDGGRFFDDGIHNNVNNLRIISSPPTMDDTRQYLEVVSASL